jgi:flagellar biosynthesis GTPase FlhF
MPSKSPAQKRLMQAAAHTKGGFGGVPQNVGKEFVEADKRKAMKKAKGGVVDPMNYDSDLDYYRASGRMKDEDDEQEEQQPPRRAIKAEEKRREKSTKKNIANYQASEMYRTTDKPEALKQFERLSRRKESNSLLGRVKSLSKSDDVAARAVAKNLRSEWSKKIGKGKPAPFKTGGSSCW